MKKLDGTRLGDKKLLNINRLLKKSLNPKSKNAYFKTKNFFFNEIAYFQLKNRFHSTKISLIFNINKKSVYI